MSLDLKTLREGEWYRVKRTACDGWNYCFVLAGYDPFTQQMTVQRMYSVLDDGTVKPVPRSITIQPSPTFKLNRERVSQAEVAMVVAAAAGVAT